ncbi:MAG TPA: ceramidase domain-containing protein [Pyrinomonadaceae bacterium]
MKKYKGFFVWILGTFFILTAFLIFRDIGWGGAPDECIFEKPDGCYCEAFKKDDVVKDKPGVRQPVNTWSNLYAIITSFIVAWGVYSDRRKYSNDYSDADAAPNIIGSSSWKADLYIFAVLFLGLGSMWFHASLKEWGGLLDGVSMYVFASYLVFYSARRFFDSDRVFWLGYLCSILFFTLMSNLGVDSVINIGILVGAYATLEIYIWWRTKVMQGKTKTVLLWIFAFVSIITATVFRALSETGKDLCYPDSWFQPHGLIWHPLAGVMAVLLYFYWRDADDRNELGTKI